LVLFAKTLLPSDCKWTQESLAPQTFVHFQREVLTADLTVKFFWPDSKPSLPSDMSGFVPVKFKNIALSPAPKDSSQ
jgi:hypothetical protein